MKGKKCMLNICEKKRFNHQIITKIGIDIVFKLFYHKSTLAMHILILAPICNWLFGKNCDYVEFEPFHRRFFPNRLFFWKIITTVVCLIKRASFWVPTWLCFDNFENGQKWPTVTLSVLFAKLITSIKSVLLDRFSKTKVFCVCLE